MPRWIERILWTLAVAILGSGLLLALGVGVRYMVTGEFSSPAMAGAALLMGTSRFVVGILQLRYGGGPPKDGAA